MKISVHCRLVSLAIFAVGAVWGVGSPMVWGQPQNVQPTQYAPRGGSQIELPSPAQESSAFPSMESMIPPSMQISPPGPASRLPLPSSEIEYLDAGAVLSEPMMGSPVFDGSYASENLLPMGYSGLDEPAPVYSSGSWWWRGNWYAVADAVVLKRKEIRDVPILFAERNPLFVQNNNDLADFNFTAGARLTLGQFLGRDAALRDHMVEFSFLGFLDWSNGRTVEARIPNTIDTLLNGITVTGLPNPGNAIIAPFFAANSQRFDYSSDYNDFQLNYRLQTRPGKDVVALQPNGMWVQHAITGQLVSVLAGMRFSSIDERAVYTSQSNIGSGSYTVSTHNDMFGFHVGGELMDVHEDWSWGLRGNTGPLLNFADRISVLTSGALEDREKVTDERLVWVIEGSLFGKYQVRPNLAFRAGYDIRYYSGLALAPVNMGFVNGFPPMNVNGSAFYHGGTVGIETTW